MTFAIAIIMGALWGGLVGLHIVLAVLACAALAWLWARSGRGAHALAGLVAALVGNFTGALPPPLGPPSGWVSIEGDVAANRCDEGGGLRCSVTLDDVVLDGTPVPGRVPMTGWREDYAPFEVGDRLATSAQVEGRRTQPNPGLGWPERQPWLRWRARASDDVPQRVATGSFWDRARLSLARRLDGPADIQAFYRAILLGDRSALPAAMRDAFVDTGTAHLLAISGLHLAVLAAVLFRLLCGLFMLSRRMAQAGRPRVPAAAATILIIWAYAVLVGSHSLATQRAAVFISVYLGALVLARQTSAGRSLWVAAAGLALVDPHALLSPGFQLSFAAAGALVAAAPHLALMDTWLQQPGRLPEAYFVTPVRFMAMVGATTLVCQLATAPLAMAWFGQSSWTGLVVNLAVIPLVTALVVPLGALWLMVSSVSAEAGATVQGLAELPARLLLDTVDTWAQWLGPAQGAAIPHAAGVLLATGVSLALVGRRRWLWVAGAASMVGVALVVWPAPPGLRMAMLDVGHGDAVVVRSPDGRTLLMDTGGTFDRGDGRANGWIADWNVVPALARWGAAHIDLMVISHAHLDHVGAAARVARRMHVRELWLSPCGRDRPAVRALVRAVRQGGGVVQEVDTFTEPRLWGDLHMRVLWPDRRAAMDGNACLVGLNDGSVVLRLDYAGRRVLLTGDIEEETETELVAGHPNALAADVLKVPHHGSRTSSTPGFLDAVGPTWALVPGELRANSHKPPHLSVLSRYHRRRIKTWVTGLDGAITVRVAPDGNIHVSGSPSGRRP